MAPIEVEALGIHYAVEHVGWYAKGMKNLDVFVDHKPLVAVFNSMLKIRLSLIHLDSPPTPHDYQTPYVFTQPT